MLWYNFKETILNLKIFLYYLTLKDTFYVPFEKKGIVFCTCRSVGRSDRQSVNQAMSAQYLLTPMLGTLDATRK